MLILGITFRLVEYETERYPTGSVVHGFLQETQFVLEQHTVDRKEHDRELVEPRGARVERQRRCGHRGHKLEHAFLLQQEHQGAEPVQ